MKRTIAVLSLFCIMIGLSLVPAAAQDGEARNIEEGKRILGKLIDALGGRDNLSKIQDTKVTCSINIIPAGIGGSLTISEKKGKTRQDIQIMGMNIIQAYDGKTGWMTDPQTGAVADMPEPAMEQYKREAAGNDALLAPDKYGITYSFAGRESIEGREYLILKQTFEDGYEYTIYVDSTTYLMYKVVGTTVTQALEQIGQETILSDYRDVDGTKVPFSVKLIQGGMEYADITVTDYKHNTGIEDSFFEKPEVAGE